MSTEKAITLLFFFYLSLASFGFVEMCQRKALERRVTALEARR